MAVHPPAMGGKTAWGVGEVMSCPTDDPDELRKIQKAAADFNHRESDRLNRLKEMDGKAGQILEARKQRRNDFQMGIISGTDEFKKRQEDILRKMQESKLQRALERKSRREQQGSLKKTKKKKKTSSSSSSSGSSSSGSSSSSSSSSGKNKKKKKKDKDKKSKKTDKKAAEKESKGKVAPKMLPGDAAVATPQEVKPEDPEAKRKANEAKQRQREAQKKAKEQLAAWEAENKRKEEELETKRKADAQKKMEEAEAKREADAKRKAEEQEAQQEEAKRRKTDSGTRKQLFQSEALTKIKQDMAKGVNQIAGGFKPKDHVVAAFDITIRGNVVVLAGTAGTVKGPADTDPLNRVAVDFVKRQDGGNVCLNVVPKEVRKG